MPFYMTQFAYTSEAWKALSRKPVNRFDAVKTLAEQLGGKMVNAFYCFGEWDGVVISEAPDDTTVAAFVMAAVAPGHIKSIKTTTLLTAEDAMTAMRKAGSVTFKAPGT